MSSAETTEVLGTPEARIVLDMAAVVLHEASDTELHRLARKIERELKRRKAARS